MTRGAARGWENVEQVRENWGEKIDQMSGDTPFLLHYYAINRNYD